MYELMKTQVQHWSLPRGCIVRRALRSDPTQEYLLYIPTSADSDSQVLVVVHGFSRKAYKQAKAFSSLCERRGVVALVPIFTKELHKDYQRLGRKGKGRRVDLILHQYLTECAYLSGADPTQIFLYGFSAGAQFAHRYLMAHPHRVSRAAVVAPGWYTFPDHTERFPFGTRPSRALAGVTFNAEQFLRIPIEVLVGELDTTDKNLRRTDRVDAQQGKTRLERARRWVAAMRNAAVAYGLPPLVKLTEIQDVGHSFSAFCARGELVERVEKALFAPPPAAESLFDVTARIEPKRADSAK